MPVTNVTHDIDTPHHRYHRRVRSVPRPRLGGVRQPRVSSKRSGAHRHPATFVEHDFVPGGKVTYYMTSPRGEKFGGWWEMITVDKPNGFTFRTVCRRRERSQTR